MDRMVFIPNRGAYDFSDAERFGSLKFLTEGYVNRFDVVSLYRMLDEGLIDAREDDYIVITSLAVLNSMASAIFARRFGRLNLLLYHKDKKKYIERNLVLS